MNREEIRWFFRSALAGLALLAASGCGNDNNAVIEGNYVLASVVIDTDGGRTTYVQAIKSLDDGPFNNENAIEMPGNGVVMAGGRHFFVGLAEEPTWVRFSLNADGVVEETGRLSFLSYGATYIDYGNALVDEDTAVSVLSGPAVAVIWNPETMEIVDDIDLEFLVEDGYDLEVWTTVAHDGLVYVPGRYANWDEGNILSQVSMTIIDPDLGIVIDTAEDDRCASGGRIVFDDDGYGYVMGDGRNYSIHMYANAAEEDADDNCLLRIAPGETDFEDDYYYTIKSLTGGVESITELETGSQGSGIGFAKMFYPDELPEGVEPVDFGFWSESAHKMWRIVLADPPSAEAVEGAPFSAIGFNGSAFNGFLYSGESTDGGATTDIYEMDPVANTATIRFSMDGYFYGLYELTP